MDISLPWIDAAFTLPKYIYLSPLLIFPTTSTELGQKTPGVNHSRHCSITLDGAESQPSLEQKRTEGYVIVSSLACVVSLRVVVSSAYCVVFLFCFSSSCVPYFSGLLFFGCHGTSVFSNVHLLPIIMSYVIGIG
jgi:hypothetical protein